jgi:hypothetical protein
MNLANIKHNNMYLLHVTRSESQLKDSHLIPTTNAFKQPTQEDSWYSLTDSPNPVRHSASEDPLKALLDLKAQS